MDYVQEKGKKRFKLAQTYDGKICILLADGLGHRPQVHRLPLLDALKGLGIVGDIVPALLGVCLFSFCLVFGAVYGLLSAGRMPTEGSVFG